MSWIVSWSFRWLAVGRVRSSHQRRHEPLFKSRAMHAWLWIFILSTGNVGNKFTKSNAKNGGRRYGTWALASSSCLRREPFQHLKFQSTARRKECPQLQKSNPESSSELFFSYANGKQRTNYCSPPLAKCKAWRSSHRASREFRVDGFRRKRRTSVQGS